MHAVRVAFSAFSDALQCPACGAHGAEFERLWTAGGHHALGKTSQAALLDRPNFTGLVLGCIEANICK